MIIISKLEHFLLLWKTFKEFNDFYALYIDIKVKGSNSGILKDGGNEFLKILESTNFCLK
jgi:hypothetical protein